MPRRVFGRCACPGRSASRSVVGDSSTDVRRFALVVVVVILVAVRPRCRPPPGRRACCARAAEAWRPSAGARRARSRTPRRSRVRRALTRSENSMSAMVRSRPTRRGGRRRGRRRNATEGARREEALPAGADCDPARRQRRRLPRQLRRRRDGHATVAATATRWPRSCRPQRMPRRTETSDTRAHAATTPTSSASRPSSVPVSACREPSAAYVDCSAHAEP